MELGKINNTERKYIQEQCKTDGVNTFIVEQATSLEGALDTNMAMQLYFAQQSGLRLRQVKILMNSGCIKTEALYYFSDYST